MIQTCRVHIKIAAILFPVRYSLWDDANTPNIVAILTFQNSLAIPLRGSQAASSSRAI